MLLGFFKGEGGKRREGGLEKRDHSLCVRYQSMVEIEIESIIGQRGNLRDKNIVMATVEFCLDSAE